MTKSVDIVSEIIGDWGPWQFRSVILIYLCKIPSAWFMACIIFTAPIPKKTEVTCSQPETQITFHQHSRTIPRDIAHKSTAPIDVCFQLNRTSSVHTRSYVEEENGTGDYVPCTSFRFNAPFETAVTKFGLVCSRSILIATSQFLHLFGVLTGGILAVKLMESTSPRTLMLHGIVFQIVFGCLAALTSNYGIHMALRYLAAVCCAQLYTAGQVIFTDITGNKYRTTSFFRLSGREHLSINTVALGISEIVGVIIGYSLIVNCKRKWQYTGLFNIFAGLFASIGYFCPNSLPPDPKVGLLMLTAIIPKIAVSCSQSILFTCTAELVTPEKRKMLMLSCVVWARMCLLTAAFIGTLMNVHQLVPLSVFGGMSAIGGVCMCLVTTSRTCEKAERQEKELPTACVAGTIFMIEKF